MIKRRKTRQVKVGGIKIGGGAPISIQSMAKIETSNIKEVVPQIKRLEDCGCEIVRVAVKNPNDASAIKDIKRKIGIPIVSDIHFDYRLALESIKNGADKIRLNPGNIRKPEEIEKVIRAAKKARIPVRIGVNSGSVNGGKGQGNKLVDAALDYVRLFERLDFHDIIISIKASDVLSTIESYKMIADLCDYPLHLGVTASGTYDQGIVKSSIGIGSLLLDGIGDTIRVSLAADPVEEVVAAKRILASLELRKFGPNIIACPTCGRCQVDLVSVAKELEARLNTSLKGGSASGGRRPLTIAIMGCEVNGPGEAMSADVGIAFGKNSGMIFKGGKVLKKVSAENAIKELLSLI